MDPGELELSTNLAENALRGVALGRKNWLRVGSAEAGPKVAAILSVVETSKRLGLDLRAYLADVLPRLVGATSIQRVGELTPSRWAASRLAGTASRGAERRRLTYRKNLPPVTNAVGLTLTFKEPSRESGAVQFTLVSRN